MENNKFDVIVVGGGHNGLTCAAYLGKSGKRVLVLEERSLVGGFCTTEDTIKEAPGFKFSPTSLDILTGNIPPSVIDELNLSKYGLEFISPDPFYSFVGKDGRSFAFYRDYRRTCNEIAEFSVEDAEAYAELTETMRDFWYIAVPYLMDHPTKPKFSTLFRMMCRVVARRKRIKKLPRLLLSSPAQILDEYFESREVKAAMANLAVGGLCQLEDAGSGIIMSIMALQHEWGVRRPVGGQGALTEALADCVLEHGGKILCDSPVSELLTRGGVVKGVRLESGCNLYADHVVGAIDPWTLYNRLCPPELIPEIVRKEFRGLGICRNNLAPARIDLALSSPIELLLEKERVDLLKQGTLLLADDLEYVRHAAINCRAGIWNEQFPLWIAIPSHQDKSLLPSGEKNAEGIYVYLPIVPVQFSNGKTWEDMKPDILEQVIDILEEYAPNIREFIKGVAVRGPEDAGQFSRVPKGHPFHVDMGISQMGPWRPIPSLSGFKSPIRNLWHAGAGAFPMGTVCGWSGRSAAREILKSY